MPVKKVSRLGWKLHLVRPFLDMLQALEQPEIPF